MRTTEVQSNHPAESTDRRNVGCSRRYNWYDEKKSVSRCLRWKILRGSSGHALVWDTAENGTLQAKTEVADLSLSGEETRNLYQKFTHSTTASCRQLKCAGIMTGAS